MRRAAVLAATIASLVLAPAAQAESWELEGPQWVQLNECAGTTAGVRASQPGDALGRPMSTRFSYQWQNAAGAWLPVPGAGSPWLAAGPGPWLDRETGWTQTFASGAGHAGAGRGADAVGLRRRAARWSRRAPACCADADPPGRPGRCRRGAGRLGGGPERGRRPPRRPGRVRPAVERSPDGVLVAEVDGRVVGHRDRRLGRLARRDRPAVRAALAPAPGHRPRAGGRR